MQVSARKEIVSVELSEETIHAEFVWGDEEVQIQGKARRSSQVCESSAIDVSTDGTVGPSTPRWDAAELGLSLAGREPERCLALTKTKLTETLGFPDDEPATER